MQPTAKIAHRTKETQLGAGGESVGETAKLVRTGRVGRVAISRSGESVAREEAL